MSEPRVTYQSQFIDLESLAGRRVLDVGSGADPFPYATFLIERHLGPTVHRNELALVDRQPVVVADVAALPFPDKSFDYIYCSHVLEHVLDPLAACSELMRVGKEGYIETPDPAKDILFAWAAGMHRWRVVSSGQTLVFLEYSKRRAEGIRSSAWSDLILSRWHHPLQDAFLNNPDIFNTVFGWEEGFSVFVFYLDGRVDSRPA